MAERERLVTDLSRTQLWNQSFTKGEFPDVVGSCLIAALGLILGLECIGGGTVD